MSALLEVKNLKMHFPISQGLFSKPKMLKAVDGVSFSIQKGETFGLVGESGCGKTTVGRAILKLYEPTSGEIWYNDTDLVKLDAKQMLPYRKKIQLIFQDPYTSLDPRMTVGEIIGAPLDVHKLVQGNDRTDRIKELLSFVGLKSDHLNRYPHEFSGGQRQRIGIARALAVEPDCIVCDEPISALDVSIQAQIINILEELQQKMGLTYLFISHDLSMVRHISKTVGVMYLGNLVEFGTVEEIYGDMRHPYTKSLLSAVPIADPRKAQAAQRIILEGDVPTPIDPPSGCPFRTRCNYTKDICSQQKAPLRNVGGTHLVACHQDIY